MTEQLDTRIFSVDLQQGIIRNFGECVTLNLQFSSPPRAAKFNMRKALWFEITDSHEIVKPIVTTEHISLVAEVVDPSFELNVPKGKLLINLYFFF